ncbi:MAG TPA: hypothetical protein VLB80_02570 [Candidatus Babeliales bacterium]|nr:hypothetical protein [Candidatus Babeliales bacterium]
MKCIKYGVLFVVLWNISIVCITLQDAQNVQVNNFFSEWSKFLDQVIDAEKYPLSAENEAIYQAFIKQGTTLKIPKATGNKHSLTDLKKQMKLIQKQNEDKQRFFEEWSQFCDSVANAKQYPISSENEQIYNDLLERGKNLSIKQSSLEELQQKINIIREQLSKEQLRKEELNKEQLNTEESKKEEAKTETVDTSQ